MMSVWEPWEMTVFFMLCMGISHVFGYYIGKQKGIEMCLRYFQKEGIINFKTEEFDAFNIKLSFLKSKLIPYNQHRTSFVPTLSILDILMFNEQSEISTFLSNDNPMQKQTLCRFQSVKFHRCL